MGVDAAKMMLKMIAGEEVEFKLYEVKMIYNGSISSKVKEIES